MPDVDHYDFFVSYARSDNANGWISNFVEELLAEHRKFAAGRDLTYFFDKHEIGAGADWQHTLNHGIAHSKLFVAFISPNYFASEWCRKEWRAWIDAEIAKHILTAGVRPVYIVEVPGLTDGKLSDHDFAKQIADFLKISEGDRVKLLAETPPVVKHLRRRQMTHNQPFCDVHSFYTEGVETLRRDDLRQVLSKLAQDLDHHAELLVKAEASDYTIHPYNKNFSGRLDELLQLREWLDKDDRTGVIHGVHGLGGIGKTELALTYAHAYASAYPGGRYLISCDGKASLSEAIRTQNDFILRFADKISDEQRKDPDEFYAAVLFHLGRRIEKLGHVLLLLDNVTDAALLSWEQTDVLTKLGPKLHLLATTRLSAPTTNNNVNETDDHKTTWISLDRLPDEDALDLLEKHRPFMNDEDREAARNIVKQLDGFTLAIELTAAYLAAKNSTSYAWMNKCLNIDALEKMANSDVKLRRHNHERCLSAILKPVLEGLQPTERRFMEYAALLPPDQVPLPWLKELITQDFPELLEEDQLENPWDEVWQRLEKLSLISKTKEEAPAVARIFRVHRLVQDLIIKNLDKRKCQLIQDRIENLVEDHCGVLNSVTLWEQFRWELKPLASIANLWADNGYGYDNVEDLLGFVGTKLLELAYYTDSELLLRRAVVISERKYGPDHSEVAHNINNLAGVLSATNRFSEATALYRRALAIDEQNYGANHSEVALRLNNLAEVLRGINNYSEAESLYRRALEIYEQSYGLNHFDVAMCLNNLAGLLSDISKLSEAESYYRRAFMIFEQHCSPVHPVLAKNLNNLALLLSRSNRYLEAEELYRQALAINEQSLGLDHPSVATNLNNLALLLHDTGRYSEAESLFRRALSIDEQSFGLDHPRVATNLNNLASLLHDAGRYSEAEALYRRVLSIEEQSLGFG